MRGQRQAAALLAVAALALAGCDDGSARSTSRAPATSSGASSAPRTGDGVIDTTIATDELSFVAGADRWIRGLAVDPGGAAVVLLEPHSQQDGFALARIGAPTGWKVRPIHQSGHVLGLGLGVGSDGTVVASEERGENALAVTRSGPAGTKTVGVRGHLPLGLGVTVTALSADGRTAYVSAYQPGPHISLLVAVDTTTGTVKATAQLDPARYVRAIVVAPDGGLVLAMNAINEDAPSATVVRLDAALHPASTVPVAATSGTSIADGLALAPDGTLWVTVLDGRSRMPATTLRLEALRPGAAAPAVVASWASAGYTVEPVRVDDLAVSPKDGTIWLLGAPGTDGENQVSLTPVSPSGTIGRTVHVDSTAYGSALAFSRDGNQVFIAGNHNGATGNGSGPVLWTVG
jgi:sugar lactone lactonase YvrE